MPSPSRYAGLALLLPLFVSCGGSGSPISPSPNPNNPTRIINVSGNLSFGDVAVGTQRQLSYTIANTGNASLTVTGTQISGGLASQTLFSFTQGTIGPGATQTVTVTFQPTAPAAYSGMIQVNGDQTGGTNTLAISGNATAPSFAGEWSGRYIVERCDGTGSVQDYFCSSRGAFPPGTDLPISLSLTQNASAVSGSISLGQVTGPVSGAVNATGTLILSGTARSGVLALQLSSWGTSVSGSTMTGTFVYNAGATGVPGVAVVTNRLSNVRR
jgi:hypothetical protein